MVSTKTPCDTYFAEKMFSVQFHLIVVAYIIVILCVNWLLCSYFPHFICFASMLPESKWNEANWNHKNSSPILLINMLGVWWRTKQRPWIFVMDMCMCMHALRSISLLSWLIFKSIFIGTAFYGWNIDLTNTENSSNHIQPDGANDVPHTKSTTTITIIVAHPIR